MEHRGIENADDRTGLRCGQIIPVGREISGLLLCGTIASPLETGRAPDQKAEGQKQQCMKGPHARARACLRRGRVVIVENGLLGEVAFLDLFVQRSKRAELETIRHRRPEPELHQRRMLRIEPKIARSNV